MTQRPEYAAILKQQMHTVIRSALEDVASDPAFWQVFDAAINKEITEESICYLHFYASGPELLVCIGGGDNAVSVSNVKISYDDYDGNRKMVSQDEHDNIVEELATIDAFIVELNAVRQKMATAALIPINKEWK